MAFLSDTLKDIIEEDGVTMGDIAKRVHKALFESISKDVKGPNDDASTIAVLKRVNNTYKEVAKEYVWMNEKGFEKMVEEKMPIAFKAAFGTTR